MAACPVCGKKRGHKKGCTAPTATGRRAPQRGRGRTMGPGDIPKHKCKKEVERTVYALILGPPDKERRTIYWRCKVCHVSMGSKTVTRKAL